MLELHFYNVPQKLDHLLSQINSDIVKYFILT